MTISGIAPMRAEISQLFISIFQSFGANPTELCGSGSVRLSLMFYTAPFVAILHFGGFELLRGEILLSRLLNRVFTPTTTGRSFGAVVVHAMEESGPGIACTRVRRIRNFFIRFEANLSEFGSYSLHIRMFQYIRRHHLFAYVASYSLQNIRTNSNTNI
jgi:hypothetical protein